MWADLFEALLGLFDGWFGIATAAAIGWSIMTDQQKAQLINQASNVIRAILGGASQLLVDVEVQLKPIVEAFATAVRAGAQPITDVVYNDFKGMAINAFNTVEKAAAAGGQSNPGDAVARAGGALAEAFALGLSSHTVAAAFEAAFPEKLNFLNGMGPVLAELAGFKEVAANIRDPLYKNAFGISAEYYYRSIFKPELPNEDDAVSWHARRFIDDAQLRHIFNYSGLKPEYEAPYIQSAYRAIQPRALASLFQDAPLDEDLMKDLLEKAGLFPQHIHPLIEAFKENSVKNVRNQALSATITAAERGTLSAAEVDATLTDMNFSDRAKHWVRLTIATRKLEQLAELYRKSISEAYKFSLITDAQYVPALQAIGIAAADANAHYAIDSEAKLGHEAAAAARAAARLAAETTRAAAAAALANYHSHNIDELALTAALAAAGVPLQVVPWAVDLAIVRRQASMRIVFGKQVAPQDAELLREQVAALKEQVTKKLLDTTSARTQLQNLGLPPTNVEDLLARWAAQALKTVLPVQ